jgi:hypothetical protein
VWQTRMVLGVPRAKEEVPHGEARSGVGNGGRAAVHGITCMSAATRDGRGRTSTPREPFLFPSPGLDFHASAGEFPLPRLSPILMQFVAAED